MCPSISPAPPPAQKHDGLFSAVFREILADESSLPSLPDIALRLREVMRDPNHDTSTIARLVQTDAAVSAHLVRVANSPLFRTRVPSEDVKSAVQRLGAQVTRNLVTAYALRSLCQSDTPKLRRLMRDVWKRSAKVGAVSAVLAKRCAGFSADRAMLGGLFQDIGQLPLIIQFGRRPALLEDMPRVEATLEEFAAKVGVVLLRHWGFDEEFVEVARSRADWYRHPAPQPDLADVVLVARLHTCVGTPGMHQLPQIDELPAFVKLQLGDLTPRKSLAIVEEAVQEVNETLTLLSG